MFHPFGNERARLVSDHLEKMGQRLRKYRRIRRTISDRSADLIPKVPDAGQVKVVNGRKVQVMHNGVLVVYGGYHGHWMADIIRRLRGHHEPLEELIFHLVVSTLPSSATMLEVGSNWAYYSLWFKSGFPGRRCFLIEPNSKNLDLGRLNFTINNLDGNFSSYFLSEKSDLPTDVDGGGAKRDVPSICIDDWLRQTGLSRLDMLHADIQGAEHNMLLGASATLSRKAIDYLFISTHGDKHLPCLDILRGYDYEIIAAHTVAQASAVDGLIVAANPARNR